MKYQILRSSPALLLLASSGVTLLRAQDAPIPGADDKDAGPAVQQTYTPLTLSEQYKFSLNKVVSFPGALSAVLHASFDQADGQPRDWGRGSDSFGVRVASRFGRSLVRQSVAFGVRAVDHEDPRYFVLGSGGTWKRTRYAIARTFIVRNGKGGMMPAYSRFVADYGMPFIAQQWRPVRFRTAGEGMRAGSLALSLGVAMNIGREFWPDARRRLLATRLASRYPKLAALGSRQ